jgi:hypothetical protein
MMQTATLTCDFDEVVYYGTSLDDAEGVLDMWFDDVACFNG